MTATAAIEIRPGLRARPRVAAVMFDFDGTISLIRAGWVEVMLEGMRALCPPRPGEDAAALDQALRHDIVRLAGRPTIDQMIVFAERLRARGAAEPDPPALKADFLRRLGERCAERHAAIARGARDAHLVPGADAAVAAFAARGAQLWLASGTDHDDVLREAALLGVDRPFAGRIYGALRPPAVMTKAMVVARMLAQGLPGEGIVAIGDGPVEMREIKAVGGLAIGIASDEDRPGSGRVDRAKRELLIAAGADAIIADFRDLPALMSAITGAA
ncbi:MAG TPA: HAD family hydrolase [Planctomycetota bacterium]|nr:HAD family hydrolase [Planctomycetota bacterium]